MKKLFYLSAGSSKWGTGHLRRSVELIGILRGRGLNVDAVALVPDEYEMEKLFSFINTYDRRVKFLHEIGEINADGIVVDVHTDFQPELFPWLIKQALPVFGLDWYHETGGIVVKSANLRGGADALKYSIVRKEFHDAYKSRIGFDPEYDAVVMVGGCDNRGYLNKIYSFFSEDKRFSDRKIFIVLGPMVDDKLADIAGNNSGRISVARNPDNLAFIMAKSAVGITNGGTSLMEFTMLGIPTLIFPQSAQEEDFIAPFLECGCSIKGSLEPEEFASQIIQLWEDNALRRIKSWKAKKLIDGFGAERIADMIFGTFLKSGNQKKLSMEDR